MVSSSPPSHTHLLAGDRFTLYFCFWLSCEICVLSCYFAVLTVKHSFEESRISSVIRFFFCFTFFRLSATREFWRTNRAWVSSSKQPFQFMEKRARMHTRQRAIPQNEMSCRCPPQHRNLVFVYFCATSLSSSTSLLSFFCTKLGGALIRIHYKLLTAGL